MTFATLRQLLNIVQSSVDSLEKNFKDAGLDYPSLDAPYDRSSRAEKQITTPEAVDAINLLVAAADQLIATARSPFLTLCDATMGYHLPACMRFAEQVNVVEILREAGPQGLHVKQIAAKADIDALKLGHALRLLATHHIFREVSPDVFANNRLSSFIDTGKASEACKADPESKYDGTNGATAFVDHAGDEMFKASSYMTENYTDPKTKWSQQPNESAFCAAFQTDKLFFPWMEQPSNSRRLRRFGSAMTGSSLWEAPHAILHAFEWTKLPECAVVVDVGGGIGSTSMIIRKAYPHLRIEIQDRGQVVSLGESIWQESVPTALSNKQVGFREHDFFEPQPVKNAHAFLLRAICHDWSDAFVLKILRHLREAAQPHTRLLLGDHILPYACADDTDASTLPGAARTLAPPPLLANLGRASATAYWVDLTMQTMFNAQERQLGAIVALTHEAGWEVQRVARAGDSRFGYVFAAPV